MSDPTGLRDRGRSVTSSVGVGVGKGRVRDNPVDSSGCTGVLLYTHVRPSACVCVYVGLYTGVGLFVLMTSNVCVFMCVCSSLCLGYVRLSFRRTDLPSPVSPRALSQGKGVQGESLGVTLPAQVFRRNRFTYLGSCDGGRTGWVGDRERRRGRPTFPVSTRPRRLTVTDP